MIKTKKQVVVGGIYRHCHGLHYRINSIGLNVTNYEKGNKTFPRFVVYTQLEAGKFPAGTIWVCDEHDFLGTTKGEKGQVVNIFELVEDKK